MKLADLKLKPHFVNDRKKIFILFCLVHVVKCMGNSLCKKFFFLNHPSLTLSTGNSIEAGVFSMHQIRKVCHTNKKNLICIVRLYQETACPSILGKKK